MGQYGCVRREVGAIFHHVGSGGIGGEQHWKNRSLLIETIQCNTI